MKRIRFLFFGLSLFLLSGAKNYDYRVDENDLSMMVGDREYAERYSWVPRSMCSRLYESGILEGVLKNKYMNEPRDFSWSSETKNAAKWIMMNKDTGCKTGDLNIVIEKLDKFFNNIATEKVRNNNK